MAGSNVMSFGSGLLFATNLAANSTPVLFGALQDVTLDLSPTIKTLFGQSQFPIAAAVGERKISGKAKIGQVNGLIYSSLVFGVTPSTGTVKVAYAEPASVPASTPFTVNAVNSATFADDLGVIDASTGLPLTQVATAPTTGQYSVAAGVYTFAAADEGKAILLNYTYTVAASGVTVNAGNPLQGVQPVFSMIVSRGYNNTGERYKLWSCISSKLSLPTKLADFAVSEFDFEGFADASNRTISIYTD